jgi:5'-nucleotidase
MRPHALITNDDSIHSAFLHCLAKAISRDFTVSVAAPAKEQSWIGRAISRRKEVEVVQNLEYFNKDIEAWAVNGTPTDCVNIALGHLINKPVDVVLSGINIGYNTTETLILSSGTVAGAIEGAQWGHPAIAFSKYVPIELFNDIQAANGRTEGTFAKSLKCAGQRALELTNQILKHPPKSGKVVNINFPYETRDNSPIEMTTPAKIRLGSFYKKSSPGRYSFHYSEGTITDSHNQTDRAALERGSISQSLLDFSQIAATNDAAK